MPSTIVILGTGGTIAGTAATPLDNVGYSAAQRSAADLLADLLASLPALSAIHPGQLIECEQVAQLDSKDMDHATWQRLAQRASHHLHRPEVAGVVITHGTDTLEETAWFLHRVLAPRKPLVLTAAMRPATSIQADGPQNLLDAVTVARAADVQGVLAVLAGTVHGAADLRKLHTYRLDAFGSGDAGPLAHVEEGRVRQHRPWPSGQPLGLDCIAADAASWPRVDMLTSHAGVRGDLIDALLERGALGLVVAGTGNGSLHHSLEAAVQRARAAGVPMWLCTRCATGVVLGSAGAQSPAAALSPWQARVELMLHLMSAPTRA